MALLEHPGGVASRKELHERLWPADTHVEFENGLNNAIAVPSLDAPHPPAPGPVGERPLDDEPAVARPTAAPGRAWRLPAAVIVGAIALAAVAWWATRPAHPLDSVAVLPFVTSTSGNPTDEYVAFGMTDAIIAELSRRHGTSKPPASCHLS